MKTRKALLLIFVLGSGPISLAQGVDSTYVNLQFYERLAKRDASYEQGVQFFNEQDEEDYWKDQKNFEKLLLQENPAAYLVYLNNKRPSYINHIQKCHQECGHGDFYKREVAFFLLKIDNDPLVEWSMSVVNTRKNRSKFK